MTGLTIIQIEVWSSTAKGRIGFDDIRSILQKNIPRNELLDLRNRLILLLLLLHPLGNANGDLLLLLGLGSTRALPAFKGREKLEEGSELLNLTLKIGSKGCNLRAAFGAGNVLCRKLPGIGEGQDDLV